MGFETGVVYKRFDILNEKRKTYSRDLSRRNKKYPPSGFGVVFEKPYTVYVRRDFCEKKFGNRPFVMFVRESIVDGLFGKYRNTLEAFNCFSLNTIYRKVLLRDFQNEIRKTCPIHNRLFITNIVMGDYSNKLY